MGSVPFTITLSSYYTVIFLENADRCLYISLFRCPLYIKLIVLIFLLKQRPESQIIIAVGLSYDHYLQLVFSTAERFFFTP